MGIVFFRYFLKKKKSIESTKKRSILAGLVIGFGILFLLFSKKFTSFYNFPVEQIQNQMTGGIKVLYANIYKNNTDYVAIEELIKQENPDLIFFVEFADHHYKHLKDVLETNYPYSNSTIRSQKYVGNMVFSKKEINNRADNFPQGAWRYGYFSVMYDNQPIYFYLVHASSPSNPKFFHMRNVQIETFFKDFDLHKEVHRERNDKVVVIGDFNTSPWSIFYWKFAEGFNREFVNITRSLPILFTRKSVGFPLFWSHIDHIFANKLVFIKELQVINIPGSDHKGFSFWIK
ncbi:hypothetical protein P148_SR1C00001G0454 [candidate division SR1 bacterium RAAC1_SR1_1]|nr:hypothetical protein P148_SR1C00001G0454 [candidate division SR1 bacterium RAAC1_SR1_1]